MKQLNFKSNLLKGGVFAIALAIGAIGFSQSGKAGVNRSAAIKLHDLSRISNANAEGSNTCSATGSACTTTLNGQPATINGYRE